MLIDRKQTDAPTLADACHSEGIAQVIRKDESPIVHASLKARGKNRKVTIAMVYDWDNLLLADTIARKGKGMKNGVRKFDRHWWKNMTDIQHQLEEGTYQFSKPRLKDRICDHKVRKLSMVSYRDHVVEHALMNVCEPYITRSYYYESAASIKGRGIHYAKKHVRRFIDRHKCYDLWWAQVDFVKCYHHIDREYLYGKVCKMFNDDGIRSLYRKLIYILGTHNGLEESNGKEGVGIGTYAAQPLVNFILNDIDREMARVKGIRNFRYCDNILNVGTSPGAVWKAVNVAKRYAHEVLRQPLHENIGVQKLDEVHPIDFVGYVFYRTHTLLRKRSKLRFIRKCKNVHDAEKRKMMLSSYKGWLMHCDGLHLWQKYTGMKSFKELGIRNDVNVVDGKKFFNCVRVDPMSLVDRQIVVKGCEADVTTRNGGGRMCILVEENGTDKKFLTNSPKMKDVMRQVQELDALPFSAILRVRYIGNIKEYYFE